MANQPQRREASRQIIASLSRTAAYVRGLIPS
jgi:hypothetical protein